jgi:hypothetical protein
LEVQFQYFDEVEFRIQGIKGKLSHENRKAKQESGQKGAAVSRESCICPFCYSLLFPLVLKDLKREEVKMMETGYSQSRQNYS